MNRLNKLWARLSANERRLAAITGTLLVSVAFYAALVPALSHLRNLDSEIESLEDSLLNSARQAALSYDVNRQYEQLARQHSTAWSDAEINDGLQRELDRLSRRDPNGATPDRLVNITSRPSGVMTPFQGYREYRTSFTTQPTGIRALAEFLRRVQESPQTLRIDRLELRRDPSSNAVGAEVMVTRTVVDSAEETPQRAPDASSRPAASGNLARNGSFEQWDSARRKFPDWESTGCDLTQTPEHATEAGGALRAVAKSADAAVYQVHQLTAGRKYRVTVDMSASGNVRLEVMDRKTQSAFEGGKMLVADGKGYRYELAEFTVPGTSGDTVDIAVPYLSLATPNSVVFADNVVIEEVR